MQVKFQLKVVAGLVLLGIAASACVQGDSITVQRERILEGYLTRLAANGFYDAHLTERLSDLPFPELETVCDSFVAAASTLHDPHGYMQLMQRNTDQYELPLELLNLYAPDYLAWLQGNNPRRAALYHALADSGMRRVAADLAIRLTPEESLRAIVRKPEGDKEFRAELLEAWIRRLHTREEQRPIPLDLIRRVLDLPDDSEAFLTFKGYWPEAQPGLEEELKTQLNSEKRTEVIMALQVQAIHSLATAQNRMVIERWQSDSEIVNLTLINLGQDTQHDHAEALREIWPMIADNAKHRFWCLYAMAVHHSGNQAIALHAIEQDGYDSLEMTLEILRHSPADLKKGIQRMLTQHQKGFSEIFLYAAKYRVEGLDEEALGALTGKMNQVTQMNALSYLGTRSGDTRLKLLDYLGHPSEDMRLSAINAFQDPTGLTAEQRNRIAPMLVKVFQTDPAYGNRQQALYVLGLWKDPEAETFFRTLLPDLRSADYDGSDYWLYRMRLMCWLGLARLDNPDAHAWLKATHDQASSLRRMGILLAYRDMERCPEFTFDDLENDNPKVVATAAACIREYGSDAQRKRLAEIQSAPYWTAFAGTHLDEYRIIVENGVLNAE